MCQNAVLRGNGLINLFLFPYALYKSPSANNSCLVFNTILFSHGNQFIFLILLEYLMSCAPLIRLTDDIVLTPSKLKEFAGYNLNVTQNI